MAVRRIIKGIENRYFPGGFQHRIKVFEYEITAYLLNWLHKHHYHIESIEKFPQIKHSDTMFIFGAGPSLKTITPEEWQKVDQHNTMGWRLFAFQEYVHADYLILREVMSYANPSLHQFMPLEDQLNEIRRILNQVTNNPCFKNATMLIQGGMKAFTGNRVFGYRIGDPQLTYCRFYSNTRPHDSLPSEHISAGVSHIFGTLTDAINLAYLGGWRKIVLIGVDLRDMSYFVVSDDEENPHWVTGSMGKHETHVTVASGIVPVIERWKDWLLARGVHLSVYNPHSLLADVLPVFQWEEDN